MKTLTPEERRAIKERYADDEAILKLLAASKRADYLLKLSLYEFGVELRRDIEDYLGEPPLIGGRRG